MSTPKRGDLRVYHIPQIPGPAFRVPVADLRAAGDLLHTLAQYDLFQYKHRIKPDYSSAQGLEVYNPEWYPEEDWEEWEEWHCEWGMDVNEHMREGSDLDTLIWEGAG